MGRQRIYYGDEDHDFKVVFPHGHPFCDMQRLIAGITVLMGSSPIPQLGNHDKSFIWPTNKSAPKAFIQIINSEDNTSIAVLFADMNHVRGIKRVVRHWKNQT
jgi:hypothetical protein